MTVGKTSALTAAFIGVFALGVAVGPTVRNTFSDGNSRAAAPPAETVTTAAPAPAATPAPARAPRARAGATKRKAEAASTAKPSTVTTPALPASEPRLHDRLKPVLNRGARMEMAAEGFRSAEEFATVAHAARNTNVPFMILKHRVLNEGRTLADAIHDSRPEVDAKAEVARATAAAKSDIAAVVG
jgi:hypothetical protein